MEKLATTTRKLALVSKEADKIGRCLVFIRVKAQNWQGEEDLGEQD